jgi:hypothetical protein
MKGPLSRLAAFKKGLILRGVFDGAGPGVSGVFEVGVRPLARSTQLWHWDDDAEEASLLQEIKLPYSWSMAARSLAASQLGGETLIGAITVVGAEGDAADVLRLAWGDEDTKRLARQLATCSVEQLAVIRSEVGPLTSRNALRRLSKLALDLDGIESADFGSLFPETTAPGNLIATLRKSIRTHLAQLARHAREEERARQKALKPFAAEISAIEVTWVGPSTGNLAARMAQGGRRKSLREFLERYVLANGALPEGTHSVPDHRGPGYNSWVVDLDSLRAAVANSEGADHDQP